MDRQIIKQIAVLHHPKIEATRAVAREIHDWLTAQKIDAWMGVTWDEASIRPRLLTADLIVVLGGDGSMLRVARMVAVQEIPIVGVNMGRLGFLSEMTPSNWQLILPKILAGQYWLEKRMMLHAQAWREDQLLGKHLALNDVVVSRGSLARVVWLKTQIDGDPLTTYTADGLILSTPTGSTAYALAAGGPILPPDLRNILVIPIAPHMSLNRAIVLPEGAVIRVSVRTDHQAILTVDGQFEVDLQDGDRIEVLASEHASNFVRTGKPTYFYHTLLDRLGPKQPEEM
ncbi:MAG: NAD(+)/NADH kinase [Anaerolineae bacterium]|nr:NAD(+)/NADH kinase [Anaerolineae bacterium]